MDEEDIKRIQENLRRLIAADKPESVIQSYLRDEGFDSAEAWRSAQAAGHTVPQGSLLGGAARAPSDRSRAASNRASNEPMTLREATRVAAAGVVPGWSDEVIGRIRSISPNQTYREAVADEREALASGRSKAGAGFIEFGSGMLTGAGATSLAARATGMGGRIARGVLGMPTGAPQTAAGAAGTGARVGATAGAAAGSGSRDDGSLGDRMTGGVVGAGVGGLLGALMGGGTTAAMNRVRPDLDATDIRTAFGADTPEARRAVRETAESFRLGERNARAELARIEGGDIAPDYPLNVADVGGPATRTQLARTDIASRGGPAAERIERTLTERSGELPAREAEAITRATGRRVGSTEARLAELETQRKAVNDLMYGRARTAARGRTITTTPTLREAFQSKDVQAIVRGVQTRMQEGARSGRLATGETFKSPYVNRAKGKTPKPRPGSIVSDKAPVLEIKGDLDPVTLSEISRRLGERFKKLQNAGDNVRASDIARFKRAIDDELNAIPEFAEANALSTRFHEYGRALEAGQKMNARMGEPDFRFQTDGWRGQAPLPVPADVAADVARITGLKEGSLPGAWGEFTRGAQAARVTNALNRTGLAPTNDNVRAVEELIFGAGPAAQMRAARELEGEMEKTVRASPSARGRFQRTGDASGHEQAARGSFIRDLFYGVNSPRLGASLALGDLARLGVYKTAAPTQAQLAAEATGLLATGEQRNALLRLIGQTQDQLDTPVRRGLFGALTYGAGGYPDSPR